MKASNKEPDVILWNCLDDEIKDMLAHNLSSIMDTITVDDMLEEIEFIAVYETPNQVGVDDDKSTVTWGKQLMLDRDKLLKELAAQVELENTSQVGVDADKVVPTKELKKKRVRKSVNAKSSQLERGQEGGASIRKIPKSDLQGSCQVYVQEDAPATVRLINKEMTHREKKQHRQLELGGTMGGQGGGAHAKKIPKPNPSPDIEEPNQEYALDAEVDMEGEAESKETRTDDNAKSNETGVGGNVDAEHTANDEDHPDDEAKSKETGGDVDAEPTANDDIEGQIESKGTHIGGNVDREPTANDEDHNDDNANNSNPCPENDINISLSSDVGGQGGGAHVNRIPSLSSVMRIPASLLWSWRTTPLLRGSWPTTSSWHTGSRRSTASRS